MCYDMSSVHSRCNFDYTLLSPPCPCASLILRVIWTGTPSCIDTNGFYSRDFFIYGELEITKDPPIRTCVRPLLTTLESYSEEIGADEVEFFGGVNTCREGK
jgi:hypothetical protein